MGVDHNLGANEVKAWREWRCDRESASETRCDGDKLSRCETCDAVQQLLARSGKQIKRDEIHYECFSISEVRNHKIGRAVAAATFERTDSVPEAPCDRSARSYASSNSDFITHFDRRGGARFSYSSPYGLSGLRPTKVERLYRSILSSCASGGRLRRTSGQSRSSRYNWSGIEGFSSNVREKSRSRARPDLAAPLWDCSRCL